VKTGQQIAATGRRGVSAQRVPRAAGILSRLAYTHATGRGVRLSPLLKAAGLTRQQLRDSAAPVSAQQQIDFVNRVAHALHDLRLLGWYYYAVASSGTWFEALQRAARCSFLVNEALAQSVIDGKQIGLRLRYHGISRHRDRHQVEFWMGSLVRMGRELTGVRLVPNRVYLLHRANRSAAEVIRFLGVEVKFGAAVDEIAFSGQLRDLPLVKADPYLSRLLIAYCSEAVAYRNRKLGSMRTRVENAIVPVLPHGNARAAHVARRLGLSQRSLARHLAHEGVSFSKLLSELRLDLARRYLKDERLSVSQVAWLLGYQDVAAFSNAFRRWTGRAPSAAIRHYTASSSRPRARYQTSSYRA
jgi:AraC-like DNA-binding protein